MANLSHYIIWALVTILYSPVFFSLYKGRWDTLDYTHAYFILPVSLWLAWRKRDRIKTLLKHHKPSNSSISLTLLITGIFMFIFGWKFDYLFITTLSLIPVLSGLVLYLYGMKVTRLLFFPIHYLLLLVPPPLGILDSITLPMRYGISVVTSFILRSFHFPLTREGLLLSIGGHEIFMGQPCSGFRSLITMASLGLVYVYLSNAKRTDKIILLVSIVPLALIGNLIRVLSLCLVTFYFGEKAGQGFFHDASGIIVFIIMTLGLIGIDSFLRMSAALPEESLP
ncbi:MAG: exosortase/archaeosortase family protein [Candidatus Omnitrophota bacterium]|jgi:exosortase